MASQRKDRATDAYPVAAVAVWAALQRANLDRVVPWECLEYPAAARPGYVAVARGWVRQFAVPSYAHTSRRFGCLLPRRQQLVDARQQLVEIQWL
jgi:hypothetical protein